MFNTEKQNCIECHNKYEFIVLDENREVVEKGTYYNSADSGVYAEEVGSSKTNSTTVNLIYTPPEGEETTIGFGITFTKVNTEVIYDFGDTIEFVGSLEISSNRLTGSISKVALGSGKRNDDDEESDEVKYWSETNCSISMGEKNTLILNVYLNFSVSAPAGKRYDKKFSSLLNNGYNYFPTPGALSIEISSVPISGLPSPLAKKVPTFMSLPTTTELGDFSSPCFIRRNPSNLEDQEGVLFLPSVGVKNIYGFGEKSNFNCGIMETMVFPDIGASTFTASGAGGGVFTTIIPVVKLYAQDLRELSDQNTDQYFYCAVPKCCDPAEARIVVNNTVIEPGSITFTDPSTLPTITVAAVGMTPDEEVDISTYRNTNVGSSYANYLFEDNGYWEPPSGSAVSPTYVYLASAPKYVVTGANISCSFQGKNVNTDNWESIGSASRYDKVTLNYDTSLYNAYRAIISAPSSSSTGYYLNETEKVVLSLKSYDRMILRIGDESHDFTKTGIKITIGQINTWLAAMGADQSKTAYTVGLQVTIRNAMFKSANTVAYMQYNVTTTGVSA